MSNHTFLHYISLVIAVRAHEMMAEQVYPKEQRAYIAL